MPHDADTTTRELRSLIMRYIAGLDAFVGAMVRLEKPAKAHLGNLKLSP